MWTKSRHTDPCREQPLTCGLRMAEKRLNCRVPSWRVPSRGPRLKGEGAHQAVTSTDELMLSVYREKEQNTGVIHVNPKCSFDLME